MLEKQSEVDNLKANVPSILSKRKGAKGTVELQEELQSVGMCAILVFYNLDICILYSIQMWVIPV